MCVVDVTSSVSRVVDGSPEVDVSVVVSEDVVDDGAGRSDGPPNSVVSGGLVLVMVAVVDGVVVPAGVDAKVGSTKSIGAFLGLSASLVNATTPQITKTIAASAATLAPRTAPVE